MNDRDCQNRPSGSAERNRDRAVAGDDIRLADLTRTEQTGAVRRLNERGKSIRDIAELLATTRRTVSRRRGPAESAA